MFFLLFPHPHPHRKHGGVANNRENILSFLWYSPHLHPHIPPTPNLIYEGGGGGNNRENIMSGGRGNNRENIICFHMFSLLFPPTSTLIHPHI
jgi:hypothetical protein